MSGLQLFVAFILGGALGVGVTMGILIMRGALNLTILTAEDIDRMWAEACADLSADVVGSFARRIEAHVTN
jgi:hypothetical protein